MDAMRDVVGGILVVLGAGMGFAGVVSGLNLGAMLVGGALATVGFAVAR